MRLVVPLLLTACLATPSLVAAQDAAAAPPAAAEDVASLDAILDALYGVISGPAGERDWDRFRSLFAPDARLVPTGRTPDGAVRLRVWTPDEYAAQAGQWFSENAFYEEEIGRTVETYGPLVHAFSTYVSRRAPEQEPFTRGINSIQLLNDGSRWWIVSIMWADQRAAGDIPARYLERRDSGHHPEHDGHHDEGH